MGKGAGNCYFLPTMSIRFDRFHLFIVTLPTINWLIEGNNYVEFLNPIWFSYFFCRLTPDRRKYSLAVGQGRLIDWLIQFTMLHFLHPLSAWYPSINCTQIVLHNLVFCYWPSSGTIRWLNADGRRRRGTKVKSLTYCPPHVCCLAELLSLRRNKIDHHPCGGAEIEKSR